MEPTSQGVLIVQQLLILFKFQLLCSGVDTAKYLNPNLAEMSPCSLKKQVTLVTFTPLHLSCA